MKTYKQKLREGVNPMARKKKFAPNDNNLAIAYYRFSSHSQNDASIDQQRDLAHEWADAHTGRRLTCAAAKGSDAVWHQTLKI